MTAQMTQVLKKLDQQKSYLLDSGIFVNTNIQKIFEKKNSSLRRISCHYLGIKEKCITPMVQQEPC
jgi:polysaccharide deacetylase 2 family uncharacterized protein YibQ